MIDKPLLLNDLERLESPLPPSIPVGSSKGSKNFTLPLDGKSMPPDIEI